MRKRTEATPRTAASSPGPAPAVVASPYTSLVPPLSDEDFQALKASILESGVLVPPVEDENGTVIDGLHRLRAVAELRAEGHQVAEPTRDVRLGLTDEEKRELAQTLNAARRHMDREQLRQLRLTRTQKRELVEEQLRHDHGRSDRQIAAAVGHGVDHKTVGAARGQLERRGEIPETPHVSDSLGRTQPAKKAARPPAAPKPLLVRPGRELEKVHELAGAGKLDELQQRGVGAAHKMLREERRKEEALAATAGIAAAEGGDQFRVQLGDALEILGKLLAGSVDCIFTDPPYNISGQGGGTKVGPDFASLDGGDSDTYLSPEDFQRQVDSWLQAMWRVLKPGAGLVLFVDRVLVSHVWDLAKATGFHCKNVITWVKDNAPPNGRGNLDSGTEFFLWAVRGGGQLPGSTEGKTAPPYRLNRPPTGQCPNYWIGSMVPSDVRRKYPHPFAKPVALVEHFLELFTEPGQLVVDPFAGSGPVMEACVNLGRRCLSSDSQAVNVALMKWRLQEALTRRRLAQTPEEVPR